MKNMDAEDFIAQHVNDLPENTLVYCDPPYFEKASRLYLNAYGEGDHKRIAGFIQKKLKKKWVVSYDNAPQILDFYKERRSFLYDLQYNASTVYKGKEVFVFADNLKIPGKSALPYIDEVIRRLPHLAGISVKTAAAKRSAAHI